jgi:hypothetical protein
MANLLEFNEIRLNLLDSVEARNPFILLEDVNFMSLSIMKK